MNKVTKFSIIIPVYNTGAYLEKCINSVLNQNYPDYEIILIDDGSKDDSFSVCKSYSENNCKIKAYTQENKGQLPTRQRGISLSNGDYCLFLDSDDWLEPNTLNKLNNVCKEFNSDMVCFRLQLVSDEKIICESKSLFHDNTVINEDKSPLINIIMGSYHLNSVCNKAVKATVAKESLFDYSVFQHIRQSEDLLQVMEFLNKAGSVLFINDVFYNYYVRESSVTKAFNKERYKDIHLVRLKVLEFGKNHNATELMINGLYDDFCNKLTDYIRELYNSDLNKSEIKDILNKIKDLSLYKDAIKNKRPVTKAWSKNAKLIFILFRRFPALLNTYFKITTKIKER